VKNNANVEKSYDFTYGTIHGSLLSQSDYLKLENITTANFYITE